MWCRILGFHTSTSLYLGVATLSLPFSSCAHINGFSGSRRATCHIRAQSLSLSLWLASSPSLSSYSYVLGLGLAAEQTAAAERSADGIRSRRTNRAERRRGVCNFLLAWCWCACAYHSEEAQFLVCAAVDRRVVSPVSAACNHTLLITHNSRGPHTQTHTHTRRAIVVTSSPAAPVLSSRRVHQFLPTKKNAVARCLLGVTHAIAGVVCVCGLWRVLLSSPVLALSVPTSVASAESESNCPFPARTHTSKSRIATWTVYTYIMYQVYKVTRAFFVWIA